jgi:membrane-associated phospholipid phosphatase
MRESVKQKYSIFCVKYLAVFQVVLLAFSALFTQGGNIEKMTVFISGSVLFLVAFFFAKILKRLINKKRQAMVTEFFKPRDIYAFPSGHSTGLVVLAYFIIEKNIYFGIIAFCIACIVMVARIKARLHDGVDILGGITLGVAVAYFATHCIEAYVTRHLITHMF